MKALDILSPMTRAGVLRPQANFAFLQGEYVKACALANDARVIFQQLDLPVDAIWLQGLEAISTQYHGDVHRARILLEDGLRVVRSLDHDWSVAWMLRNLGRIAHDQEEDEIASKYLEESLHLTRGIGDTRSIALSLHYLGVVALESNPKQSYEHLNESIVLFRHIGDRRGLAWALHYLATAAVMLGDIAEAQKAEAESLSLRKELGDRRGIAECLEGHAIVLTTMGQAEAAIRLFATAATLRESIAAPGPSADQQRTKLHLDAAMSIVDESVAAEALREGTAQSVEVAVAELTVRGE